MYNMSNMIESNRFIEKRETGKILKNFKTDLDKIFLKVKFDSYSFIQNECDIIKTDLPLPTIIYKLLEDIDEKKIKENKSTLNLKTNLSFQDFNIIKENLIDKFELEKFDSYSIIPICLNGKVQKRQETNKISFVFSSEIYNLFILKCKVFNITISILVEFNPLSKFICNKDILDLNITPINKEKLIKGINEFESIGLYGISRGTNKQSFIMNRRIGNKEKEIIKKNIKEKTSYTITEVFEDKDEKAFIKTKIIKTEKIKENEVFISTVSQSRLYILENKEEIKQTEELSEIKQEFKINIEIK